MRIGQLSRYAQLVLVLVVGTFGLRLWSVSRWSWNSDDWIYMHDASVRPFVPFLLQTYNGHFMPGQFAVVWVLNAVAPLDHAVVAFVTAAWAAALAGLWAVALRDLWGTGTVTWVALLLVTWSPLMVHSTMWWAAALQTLSLQTCFAACIFFVARLLRTGGAQGMTGLLASYAGGLLMWEKAVFLLLPLVVILVHATSGPMREAVRRYRRVLAWLAGISAGYVLVFLAAVRLSGTSSANAVHLDLGRSVDDVATFNYDLWAHLLAPGMLGGPWGTLPTPEEFDSRPGTAVSIVSLLALLVLVVWLLRWNRRAWLPLAAALLYAAAAWGTILFSSRYEIVVWHRLGYERYAIDAFVVLVILVGEAASRREDGASRTFVPRRLGVVAVVVVAASLGVASVAAVQRFGVSPTKTWLANLEDGAWDQQPVTLVDRWAPEYVMPPAFWGDRARLSYLLAPWQDGVAFQGPATELSLVDDDGRVSPASFSAVSTAPIGPVPDCGYAVDADVPQTVDLEPDLFGYEWTLKVDAFSAGDGTLLVRGDEELEMPVPSGLSSHLLVFTGEVDSVELQMAEGSGTACVTGISVGNLSATEQSR